MRKKRALSLILVVTLLISLFQGVLPVAGAEKTMETVDASASNWTPVFLTGSDVEGGAAFTGNAGTFGTGTTLNTQVDVTEAVEFDLTFTEESMAVSSHYAIVFGVDASSYANTAKGATFVVGKMAENVIYCQQATTADWREYTYANTYTYRFEKGTDAWILYLKGAGADQSDLELGRVSFDTFAADGFANGKATFGVYLFDSTNTTNTVEFEVTNVKHMIEQEETPVVKVMESVDASASNWTPVFLTGSDVEGGAAFTGNAGTFGTGTTLNTQVDVTEAVEFDLTFTEESMAVSSHYAIVFGVDASSYANTAKGATFVVGKMAENVIYCQQATTADWREYTYANTYTYRFEKGTDAWILYLKGAGVDQSDLELGRVSFDTFAADGFTNGKATFGVYLFDSTNTTNTVEFEVTNVKHMIEQEETPVVKVMESVDASASNWTPVFLTGSDVEGGAAFTGNAGTFGTGTTLNTQVDVTEAVEFDLTFTEQSMAVSSHYAIVFGVDASSYANTAKGATFVVGKMAENVIYCQQATTADWREYTYANTYTYRFEKGTDAWILYLKGAGVDQSDLELGRVSFDTFAADGFANGKATFGVYLYDSANTTNAVAFEITNMKHMTVVRDEEEGEKTPILDAYDLYTYTLPYWTGDTVYNESVMIRKNEDGSIPTVKLLYPATEIISVRSSDLKTEYIKGTDWDIENGKLVILENSSIPFMTYDEYYPNRTGSDTLDTLDGKKIYFTEGSFFHNKQIAVTYKHTTKWSWSVPEYKGSMMPKTLEKLQNDEALKIVFYGDSITTGANSSSKVFAAPYAATWMKMFEDSLKEAYGNKHITSVNTAVGGMTSGWGVENVQERVVNHNPDLLVIGFGMNDGNGSTVSPETYKNNINQIIQAAKAQNPNVEVLLVSPMLPNPEVEMTDGNQALYEEQLRSLETEGITLAPVTTMYKYLMMNKRYYDMTGNNVNHPNDFVTRLYAQTLNAVMIESEEIATSLYPENTYVLPSNDEYWSAANNATVEGGVITLGESGVASYIGSKLTNDLAQFDFDATIPSGKWVGFMAKQSSTGDAPWDQVCYLVLITSSGEIQLLECKDGAMELKTTAQTTAVQNGELSRTTVRFGVLNQEDGARIILDIAGTNVINYLDTVEPITTVGHTGFVTLETATANIYPSNIGVDPNAEEDKEVEEEKDPIYKDKTFVLSSYADYWNNFSNTTAESGKITINSDTDLNGAHVYYVGSKLHNKLAKFDYVAQFPTSNEDEGWVGFVLRASNSKAAPWDADQPYAYLLYIERNGTVTVLKYKSGSPSVVGTGKIKVNSIKEETQIRVGAITEAASGDSSVEIVKIILDIGNGSSPLIITDNDNPILKKGYTGFYVHGKAQATMTLLTDKANDDGDEPYLGTGKGDGYIAGELKPEWINNRPEITDGPMFIEYINPTDSSKDDVNDNDASNEHTSNDAQNKEDESQDDTIQEDTPIDDNAQDDKDSDDVTEDEATHSNVSKKVVMNYWIITLLIIVFTLLAVSVLALGVLIVLRKKGGLRQ